MRDGFIVLPSVVPREMTDEALHAIFHQIGQGIPKENLREWQARSFFPELASGETFTNLLNTSGLRETIGELLGQDLKPAPNCQLALRFPRAPGTEPTPPLPHLDGIHTPANGVPAGTLSSFTALAGVFLTDVTRDFAGNFTVWPGSHRKMERAFRRDGIEGIVNGRFPEIDYGEPLQIQARAGDAVLAHYQLLHGVAANASPFPRFATFFRIKHPRHDEHRLECLCDLWREWPGLKEIVGAEA